MQRRTAKYTIVKWLYDFLIVLQSRSRNTTQCTAILFVDNNILCNVNQTTSQVTGIRRLKGGIRKTLTGTVGRDKVLKYR